MAESSPPGSPPPAVWSSAARTALLYALVVAGALVALIGLMLAYRPQWAVIAVLPSLYAAALLWAGGPPERRTRRLVQGLVGATGYAVLAILLLTMAMPMVAGPPDGEVAAGGMAWAPPMLLLGGACALIGAIHLAVAGRYRATRSRQGTVADALGGAAAGLVIGLCLLLVPALGLMPLFLAVLAAYLPHALMGRLVPEEGEAVLP